MKKEILNFKKVLTKSVLKLVLFTLFSVIAKAQTNENPPPYVPPSGDTCALVLDDIVASGFIRACVGDNGALGNGSCPDSAGGIIGLRIDPDGFAGPLVESEDVHEGFNEERFCVEYNTPSMNVNLCNAVTVTQIPGFTQTNTSTPGQLQATGSVTTVDNLRIDQVVTLVNGSLCLNFEITLTNVSDSTLTDVEYLRNHDPDIGIDIIGSFTTDNQTINRPLPSATPPMIVAAAVKDFSPVETRVVGLGTSVIPSAGVVSDVSINTSGLVQTDPDAVIDGLAGITRGPSVADVANTIAFRIDSLEPGAFETLTFCYCFFSDTATLGSTAIANGIVGVFESNCELVVEEGKLDIKPGSCPNPFNVKSNGKLPVAILGTVDFDVNDIDVSTVELEGVSPIKSAIEDVSRPVEDRQDVCDCTTEGPDGFDDLTLKFNTQDIVAALGAVSGGDTIVLTITGELNDGTTFEEQDCIIITPVGGGNDTAGAKVAICHIPPGNPANAHTIFISPDAINAHLAHGDNLGVCDSAAFGGNNNSQRLSAYPNPFSETVVIQFQLNETVKATLKVYDKMGKLIATLFDGTIEENNLYSIKFNAEDLPTGIYFYSLETENDIVKTKEFILK